MKTNPLEPLLAQLADMVADRVLAKLGATRPSVYTTNKLGPNLPGKSRGWMLGRIKTMPGAIQVGRDWQISAADYDAWMRAQDARTFAPKVVDGSVDELAERFLLDGGHRLTSRKAG